jgi:hypothetical protein
MGQALQSVASVMGKGMYSHYFPRGGQKSIAFPSIKKSKQAGAADK